MAKVKVPLYGNPNRAALIDTDATAGATIGVDLRLPDGSVATVAALAALLGASSSSSSSSFSDAVIWQRVLQKPGNITQVEALSSAGLVTRLADGSWTTRSIATADAGRITVTDGGGATGNPTLDLATITPGNTGSLIAITVDSYGRVTGSRAVTDADIPNLPASKITSGTFNDARIAESNVTQHTGAINHDALFNYVADEHIDHSSVEIQAGTGLTGGGDLTESRELALDSSVLSVLSLAASAVQPEDLAAITFLTADDETASLAGALQLVAGSNITLDDSTPGQLVISASGGGGSDLPADPDEDSVLTWNDTSDEAEWTPLTTFALLAKHDQVFSGRQRFTADANAANGGAVNIIAQSPTVTWQETDQGTDGKNWAWQAAGGIFRVIIAADSTPGSVARVPFQIARGTGTGEVSLIRADATEIELNGSSILDFNGPAVFSQALTFDTTNPLVVGATAITRDGTGSSASVVLNIDALADDGQTAYVRINRSTNTSAQSGLLVLRGDNSTDVVARILSAGSGTFQGAFFLREGAAAFSSSAAYGQIWVKNDTPNTLWFTDDAGNDAQVLTTLSANVALKDGVNLFTGGTGFGTNAPIQISNAAPSIRFHENDAAANNQAWTVGVQSGVWGVRLTADSAASTLATPFNIARTDDVATEIELNATTLDFNGDVDISGSLVVGGASVFTSTGVGSSAGLTVTGGVPVIRFVDTNAGTNNGIWEMLIGTGGVFTLRTRTDADGAGADAISISRTGTTVDDVTISSTTLTTPSVRITSTTDASLASTGHGLQIGADSGTNLIFDTNEMICRDNGAAATVYINNDGGDVSLGGANSTVLITGAGAGISFGSRTGTPLVNWYSTTYYTQVDSNSLNMRSANFFRIFCGQTPSGGTGEITTAAMEINDSIVRFHTGSAVLYSPSASTEAVFRIGAGAASNGNVRQGLDITHRAQTGGNTSIDSLVTNASIRMWWHEGSQDIAAGEGAAIDFGHQLAGDSDPVFNVRIVSRKTSTADTNRAHSLRFYVSDGNSTDALLACEMVSTLGVTSPIDFVVTSDRRLKSEIRPIDNALDRLARLGSYTFQKAGVGHRQAGFIAQEVAEVLEEAVFELGEDGYLHISPLGVIALIAAAVNELREEIRGAA